MRSKGLGKDALYRGFLSGFAFAPGDRVGPARDRRTLDLHVAPTRDEVLTDGESDPE